MGKTKIGERGIFKYNKETGKFDPVKEKPKAHVAPYIQTDTIEPMRSHATYDSPTFESKSALRRHYKDHGFRETGCAPDVISKELCESQEAMDRENQRAMKEDLEQAYYDAKYDRIEFTEAEKENHRREERLCKKKLKSPY